MKLRSSLAVAGIATALVLTGCAGGGDANDGASASGAALTIAKPDGAITTESHNPYLGDSSASKYGYAKVMFEPLALVNPTGDLGTTPWLAETVEWNDDYTELTVVPRSGVTWSDGTEFTGDDIVFTFDQYLEGRLADTSGLNYEGATVDGDAITLSFADAKYTAQARVLHTPIVPQHIWKDIDDPNTDPLTEEGLAVGTGPYVLDSWSTESVTLTANPDYWGGGLTVPELHYVSYGDNAALTTALVSGEADWAQAFIPQIEESYLAADEKNHFLVSPTAGAGTLFMNLQTKPFNNPALREALAWTIDRQSYVDIAREGASEPVMNVTGLGELLEDEIIEEYQGVEYEVDIDKARQILTDAGYTWSGDTLVDPDGEAVSFSISVPAGWSDWNTEQALLAEELDEALGIEVRVDQPDWGGWDAARQEGTFQAIIHWLEDTGNAYGLYTSTMDPKWIVDGRAAFNFGRFEDPTVTEALTTYANASSDEDRQAAVEVLQTAFVENVPAIPLGAHPLLGEFNTRNYVGWPSEDDAYASADPTQPGIVQVLTQLEPAEKARPGGADATAHPSRRGALPRASLPSRPSAANLGEPPRKRARTMRDPLLTVRDFSVVYDVDPPVAAVENVTLELRRGEILGLAGESGCGKTTLAYGVQRLLKAPAVISSGSVVFHDSSGEDVDINSLDAEQMRRFRWDKISMVFQGAMNALNPIATIGSQIEDVFEIHRPRMTRAERRDAVVELLEVVKVGASRSRSFPHELSGGMRQRVMIAMALALRPQLMVMDEPTTALDVLVQREILRQLSQLRHEFGFSVIFITHDLPLLLEISDRIAIMREGRIVELATAERIWNDPQDEYTKKLLSSFPRLTGDKGVVVR